jgi:hypothetical protein
VIARTYRTSHRGFWLACTITAAHSALIYAHLAGGMP